MSNSNNLMGSNPQVSSVALVDTEADPPSGQGAQFVPWMFTNRVPTLRDRNLVKHPLVVGADGAGVVNLALAGSPYSVGAMDRIILVDTSDGAVTAVLPAAGGPFDGRPLTFLDVAGTFGTNALTVSGNGRLINGAASVVSNVDGQPIVLMEAGTGWAVLGGAGAVPAAPATHAPSHLAGGTDDLLSEPGVIGGTTPDEVNTDSLYIVDGTAAAVTGKTQVVRAGSGGLSIFFEGGQELRLSTAVTSATMKVIRYSTAFQLADTATYDIALGGAGGKFDIAVVGATSSQHLAGSFAQNGTPSFSGVAYTGSSTTLGTPLSLNVGASAGNFRVENLLGGAAVIIVTMDFLVSV